MSELRQQRRTSPGRNAGYEPDESGRETRADQRRHADHREDHRDVEADGRELATAAQEADPAVEAGAPAAMWRRLPSSA